MFGKKSSTSIGNLPGAAKPAPPPAAVPPPAAAPATSASGPAQAPATPAAAGQAQAPAQAAPKAPAVTSGPATISFTDPKQVTPDFMKAKQLLTETLLEQINFEALEKISKDSRKGRISDTVDTLIAGINVPLTASQT